MQLDGQNLVDPASVIPYYAKKGLALDLLRQCNSQEFRFIDGYGKGHFLMTQTITSEEVVFTVGSRTVSLKVTDVLSLEHPSHSGGLMVYITAEPKYYLLDIIVERNYNITIDKSIPKEGVPTIVTLYPDITHKTLKQVIKDILPIGYTLEYRADRLVPLDISIEGLSVLAAIDHLCAAYGLIWTASAGVVYVWDMQAPDPGSSSDAGSTNELTDPINDIYHTLLPNNPTNINVAFPIYEYARQVPREYYVYEDSDSTPSSTEIIDTSADGSGQGQTVNVMVPYHKAITDINGVVRNRDDLDEVALIVIDNLKGIKNSYEYVMKEFFEAAPVSFQPISLSEVYGDWGRGPRSIYRSIHYPYILVKIPPCLSRYANNWRGTLTDGYSSVVPHFTVTPVVGLDGRKPPGDQKVYNIYKWPYGEAGWAVRVEWNNVCNQWEAIQQEFECPPSPLPEEPTQSPTVDPWPITKPPLELRPACESDEPEE